MHLAQDAPKTNSTTDYGKNVVEDLKQEEKLEQSSVQKLSKDQEHVLKTFRILIADLCQQFNGGHPGCVPIINTVRGRKLMFL
jgi:dihydroxyacetone synthase